MVVYYRQTDSNWLRLHEIYPPSNSRSKKRGYGFGYDIALNDNILVIHAFDYKYRPENWIRQHWLRENWFDGKTGKEEIYLTFLASDSVKPLQRIRLPRANLYFGGIQFLEDKAAFVARVKGFSDQHATHLFLVNPLTRKVVKDLKITDSDYDNLEKYGLGIDSDNKTLAIVLRDSLLQEKLPLSITADGKVEKINLDKKDIDSASIFKDHQSIRSETIRISEDLLVIGNSQGGEFSQTMFWQRSPQPSLIDFINMTHKISVSKPFMLFSIPYLTSFFSGVDTNYVLIQVNENEAITKSKIRWSCTVEDLTVNNDNYDDRRYIFPPTTALIDSDSLLLSGYGTVVNLPLKNLSNSLEIKHPNCKE